MNQKLADWASVAEIVSGIAIVVTLAFLILGIKENTEVTRASMYQQTTNQIIQWRNQEMNTPELPEASQAFFNGDVAGLSGRERLLLRAHTLNLFQIYEQAYFAEQYGVLGPSEWSRFEVQICTFFRPVQDSTFLTNSVMGVMTEEFGNYMQKLCQE